MKHVVPHDLPEALAKTTVERALGSYREKYPHATMDLAWVDERTAKVEIGAKGFDVKGTLSISSREIVFDLAVPFLLRPLQSKAMAVLDREVSAWIKKARDENA
ncbi:MAG: polyhydroxyalkanoic acid system family protein [Deltaproteobacteria bacterium]|nr:polyhydroxyalkanoic acid system family protein [Deltaproteobacteria bacterium]